MDHLQVHTVYTLHAHNGSPVVSLMIGCCRLQAGNAPAKEEKFASLHCQMSIVSKMINNMNTLVPVLHAACVAWYNMANSPKTYGNKFLESVFNPFML